MPRPLVGESMELGIQPSYILGADEAIVLTAVEEFDDVVDGKKVHRRPGQCWMITGPTEYIPPVDVTVVETRCVCVVGVQCSTAYFYAFMVDVVDICGNVSCVPSCVKAVVHTRPRPQGPTHCVYQVM